MSAIKSLALLALATGFASVANAGASGTGKTTRYWDCCKGSCAWTGKADVSAPVTTCDKNNNPLTDANAASACAGGSAYMCSDQSPWAVSDDLAYGFAAVNIAGGSEKSWCCSCYKLTFTTTSLAGKSMIVQATNTGGDLGSNQFDLAIPGGGVGIFNACTDQFSAPSSGWGAQYGGISSNTCSAFPKALQAGCGFRWDWFEGADNPEVKFEQVACPAEITAKSGCKRNDDEGAAPVSSSTAPVSSSAAPDSPSSADQAKVGVASSSSGAAPVAYSSSSAISSAYTAPAVESSAAATSDSSASSFQASQSSSIAVSSAAAPSASAPSSDDPNCKVQYVYEYDL